MKLTLKLAIAILLGFMILGLFINWQSTLLIISTVIFVVAAVRVLHYFLEGS